jgi:hypothetical protein
MAEIPQDVRALAAGIADDIERNGHFRHGMLQFYVPGVHEDAPCCIIQSPTWYLDGDLWGAELCEAILGPVAAVEDEVVDWNDHTPTPEVLATLRKIAAGEQP